jgi:hypothetical protein
MSDKMVFSGTNYPTIYVLEGAKLDEGTIVDVITIALRRDPEMPLGHWTASYQLDADWVSVGTHQTALAAWDEAERAAWGSLPSFPVPTCKRLPPSRLERIRREVEDSIPFAVFNSVSKVHLTNALDFFEKLIEEALDSEGGGS